MKGDGRSAVSHHRVHLRACLSNNRGRARKRALSMGRVNSDDDDDVAVAYI